MAIMRFQGYSFPYNPKKLEVRRRRQVVRISVPEGGVLLQDMGPGETEILGEGEFLGELAQQEYERLQSLLETGGSGQLVLPDGRSLSARLCSVSILGEAGGDTVTYRFQFFEEMLSAESGLVFK